MGKTTAAASRNFTIGQKQIRRLGYGSMQLAGRGVWGEPADPAQAKTLLKSLPSQGIDFIDTADSYGPFVTEELIAEALHPYDGLCVATKGGLVRTGPSEWSPVGRPEYLKQCVLMSLRRLKVEQIDLWQLHRIDPKVPRDEQFDAIAGFLRDGLIAGAGLSQVSVEDVKAARKVFPVLTVQNRYNLADRSDEDVLEYCEQNGIGFIPWYPLASGKLAQSGGVLDEIARRHGASASQIALAWILMRSKVMLPIPGTANAAHLAENVAAASIVLSTDEFEGLSAAGGKHGGA